MKKSELKQIIKEEVKNTLRESKQKEIQIWADNIGLKIKNFKDLLRKKGYNV